MTIEKEQPKKKSLPFSRWWPMLIGALCGVALRLIFWAGPGHGFSAMAPSFIFLAPFVVGAVTVYVSERYTRRTTRYNVIAGMMANLFFVIGTMLILIEGLICAILIVPMFMACGAIGAAIMSLICHKTNWPTTPLILAFVAMPMLLTPLLPTVTSDPYVGVIERTVIVNADAPEVWRQLHDTRDIKKDEVGHGWMYRIGVPTPEYGVTRMTPTGPVRDIRMGKGIHFSQHAAQWEINRYVRWTYKFDEDSFPPGAMDDHVRIGGHYFDVIDSDITLTPVGPHSTQMTMRMHYRVSTQFNWYAKILAKGLIGNFEEVILDLYAHRAE